MPLSTQASNPDPAKPRCSGQRRRIGRGSRRSRSRGTLSSCVRHYVQERAPRRHYPGGPMAAALSSHRSTGPPARPPSVTGSFDVRESPPHTRAGRPLKQLRTPPKAEVRPRRRAQSIHDVAGAPPAPGSVRSTVQAARRLAPAQSEHRRRAVRRRRLRSACSCVRARPRVPPTTTPRTAPQPRAFVATMGQVS